MWLSLYEKIYLAIYKNIFNNLLINVSHRTCILLFQKLPNVCTTPEPKSTPVLPRSTLSKSMLSSCSSLCKLISSLKFSSSSSTFTISFYSFILIILYIYIYISSWHSSFFEIEYAENTSYKKVIKL